MTKLRAVLTAAAALILTGTAVGVALNLAGQQEGMTTEQWCKAIDKVSDIQKRDRFFVAIQSGATIPKAHDDRVLGDCSGGTCTIAPDAAPECAYTYTYDLSGLVAGWRVAEVWAHPYIAGAWKAKAASSAEFRWYGSLSAVVAACQANFTGAQCLNLLQADSKCWLLTDGSVCRFGSHLGTEDPCPYANVQARLPCTVYRGAGSEMQDATRVWTDAELDEL